MAQVPDNQTSVVGVTAPSKDVALVNTEQALVSIKEKSTQEKVCFLFRSHVHFHCFLNSQINSVFIRQGARNCSSG